MVIIGIDIGGTSIKGAAVRNNSQILGQFVSEVIKGESSDDTINRLIKNVLEFIPTIPIDSRELCGIGIGVPGSINTTTGYVNFSPNLKWYDVPLKKMMEDATHLPVKITNDANAAGLGEAHFGSGKQFKDVIVLTLGTGVGGAIILDHKLFEGNEGKAAEMGHMVIELDGRPCGCGRNGCLESYASATALINDTKHAMEENKDSLLWKFAEGDINKVNGKTPFDAAKAGDKVANEVINNYVKYLGEGILNYCNIFRPNAVIISGGISKQGDYLFDKLKEYCAKWDYGYPNTPVPEILPAVLGYESGMVGAACLFF